MKKQGTFGKLLQQATTDGAVQKCERGDLEAFHAIKGAGLDRLTPTQRRKAAAAFYDRALVHLGEKHFDAASSAMSAAADLAPQDELIRRRSVLLKKARDRRDRVARTMSIQEMQRELQSICTKSPCVCASHLQVAVCREIVDSGFPTRTRLQGVPVHTMGPYRAYTKRGTWTKLLRLIKAEHEPRWLSYMADIVADYLVEDAGDLLGRLDILVPIPADPNKFVNRGFAPNEVLADHLSERLGLPAYPALVRAPGLATREASYDDLADEFRVEERYGIALDGLRALLVEDIWTWGRTIPICAEKIRAVTHQPVVAIALAQAER